MLRNLCTTLLISTLSLATAACSGDDEVAGPDASTGVDAATPDAGPVDECTCLALGSDYQGDTGAATAIGLPSLTTHTGVATGGIGGDPVVRYQDGRFYVVNRFGAAVNVTVVDPSDWTVEAQFSPGASANPQDIAVKGDKAYVVTLAENTVKVFDLTDTLAAPTTIPLPTLAADVDGNPDATSIAIVGDRAYVVVQHLEGSPVPSPVAEGQIVVIDTTNDTVVTSVDLENQNPTNFLRVAGADLYVATTPNYSPTEGCLEKITTGATPAATCLATSVALGGYVTGIAPSSDGSIFVATAQSFSAGKVVRVAANGTVEATAYTPAGQQPTDIATCGKYLVANDAATGGIRVYDTTSKTELTTAPINVGEPTAFASGIACFAN